MRAMLDLVARHKSGAPCGIVSVCSAHPLVVEASLRQAMTAKAPIALIEATCNQVNQDGGYTGMQPADFRDFVFAIADRVGLPRQRLLLGGDHLGPNPWTHLSATEAMDKAEIMVDAYVRAGFRKIHADCSMSCADDPVPLPEQTIAERAARLIAAAEKAWREAGGEAPVYVIGTEVPVPGGASEDLPELEVTSPEAALATIRTHERIFHQHGLDAAWPRVIAEVVQPGVEFDHHKVIDYDRAKAKTLSRAIESLPTILYEAHSTDYQTAQRLRELVEDHFAILKVGPGVTFALREALWALDSIEREWIADNRSDFRDIVLGRMQAEPRNWSKYYHASGRALTFDLQYSLSDRIRYYWPDAQIMAAQQKLFDNLTGHPPPLSLISQYLPDAYAAIRSAATDERLAFTPARLVMAHIGVVLDGYYAATQPHVEMLDA